MLTAKLISLLQLQILMLTGLCLVSACAAVRISVPVPLILQMGICGISVFECLDDDWPNDSILRLCIRLGPNNTHALISAQQKGFFLYAQGITSFENSQKRHKHGHM